MCVKSWKACIRPPLKICSFPHLHFTYGSVGRGIFFSSSKQTSYQTIGTNCNKKKNLVPSKSSKSPKKYYELQRSLTVGRMRETNNFLILALHAKNVWVGNYGYIMAVSFIGGGNLSTLINHWPAASHWQTLSHNVISSTPLHEQIWTHNFSGDRHWCKSIYSTITTMMAPLIETSKLGQMHVPN